MSSRALNIRALLMQRGYTMSSVAHVLGVTPSAVQYVVSGHSRSRKIERRISQIVGARRDMLFPAHVARRKATHNLQPLVSNG